VELREALGLNQAALARELGVPTNTLSRWETGATTPDANSLAAVHSVASDHGVDLRFFRRVTPSPGSVRPVTRLAFVWDLATAGVAPDLIPKVWSTMAWYLAGRFPAASQEMRLLALDPLNDEAAQPLEALGFRVLRDRPGSGSAAGDPGSGSGTGDLDLGTVVSRVARFGRGTALVLASADSDTGIIDRAEAAGADVYVWSPNPGGPLANRAALGRLIRWHEPHAMGWYVQRVAELDGRRTSRARWAQLCRAGAANNPRLLPTGLGLRSRGGYWEVLTRLASMGFIALSADPDEPRYFTATVRDLEPAPIALGPNKLDPVIGPN